MSIASEITRLQNAKTTLKTKLNSRNDNQHQITNELIDEYGDFVDSIPSGGGSRDWSEIGYSSEPDSLDTSFNFAKSIYDNWNPNNTSISTVLQNEELIYAPLLDTSNVTSFKNCFLNDYGLRDVPQLDTSNSTDFSYMFKKCESLKTIPLINTSKGTNFSYMFSECNSLESLPQLDTSKGTNLSYFHLSSTYKVLHYPEIDCSNAINVNNIVSVSYSDRIEITFDGFKNLGQAYLITTSANNIAYKLSLTQFPGATHDSLMNVINKLYDIATKGCNTQALNLGSRNLAKLTAEEIAIATNKGWSVS